MLIKVLAPGYVCPFLVMDADGVETAENGDLILTRDDDGRTVKVVVPDDLWTHYSIIGGGEVTDAHYDMFAEYGRMMTAFFDRHRYLGLTDFEIMVDEWYRATCFMSSPDYNHPTFRRIVALGEPALPEIIGHLPDYPFLFKALEEITGEDHAASAEPGKIDERVELWLQWWDNR